jgi:cathepsin B
MCEGIEKCCRGCTGGYPRLAFEFFNKQGVVAEICMPYNLTRSLLCPLPKCKKPLDDQVYKAKDTRQIFNMVDEIRKNGPVVATFTVFEDFMTYSSGVYKYTTGRRLGLHAVKVVGYGVSETGVEYFAAQNSWGTSFGMNGSFLIAAETCGFTESVYTATPCLPGDICIKS